MPYPGFAEDDRSKDPMTFPEAEVQGLTDLDDDTTQPVDGGRGEDVDPRLDATPSIDDDADELFL